MARVNRAQFASHCLLCDETIWPGEEIIFDQATQSWIHVGCSDDDTHPSHTHEKEELPDDDLFYDPTEDSSALIDDLNLTDL